ncbi:hypothetical protein, partial [Klebsiella pneumoniae]|uniref:hypothetical protein n=1 Tax=Klebsiella pneumoniae TaxID=573 RepID=UPI0019D3F276|nr:hypothetical protein [Klebsiella pneumoniae]
KRRHSSFSHASSEEGVARQHQAHQVALGAAAGEDAGVATSPLEMERMRALWDRTAAIVDGDESIFVVRNTRFSSLCFRALL